MGITWQREAANSRGPYVHTLDTQGNVLFLRDTSVPGGIGSVVHHVLNENGNTVERLTLNIAEDTGFDFIELSTERFGATGASFSDFAGATNFFLNEAAFRSRLEKHTNGTDILRLDPLTTTSSIVPEPSTYIAMLLGLTFLGFRVRKTKVNG